MLVNLKINLDQIVRLFSLFQRERFLSCLIRLRIPSIEDDVYVYIFFQNYNTIYFIYKLIIIPLHIK